MAWKKSSEELIERFYAALPDDERVERRWPVFLILFMACVASRRPFRQERAEKRSWRYG